MIGYLKGKIKSVNFESVLVDVNGIGYEVHMSVRDVANIKNDQVIELLITEAIREQSYDLYGFLEISEKRIFDQLLKVNGVGPRIGLALLSVGQTSDLFAAISSEDISYLTQAPGVGKKMAEKMIIELRDKVPQLDPSYTKNKHDSESSIDAEAALLSLGFKMNDIRQMVDGIDKNLPVEEQIKQALSRK